MLTSLNANATASESWITTSHAACQGLTIGWTPTLASLKQIVGPRWQPARGPVKDHGILLLFATSCPQSRIGRTATGPFTIGALIVPVEKPIDTHGVQQSNGHGWAVIPEAFGSVENPVMQLFKRHGFGVTHAKVTLTVHSTVKGNQVSMSFVTPKGRMQIHALVSGETKRFDYISALAGTNPLIFSLFTGPESASRQAQGTATVTAHGDTWISRLGLDEKPKMVMLDRDFVWSFRFSDQSF